MQTRFIIYLYFTACALSNSVFFYEQMFRYYFSEQVDSFEVFCIECYVWLNGLIFLICGRNRCLDKPKKPRNIFFFDDIIRFGLIGIFQTIWWITLMWSHKKIDCFITFKTKITKMYQRTSLNCSCKLKLQSNYFEPICHCVMYHSDNPCLLFCHSSSRLMRSKLK